MEDLRARLRTLGVELPEVLLPASDVDLGAWAVVACDQYSSERDYWERVGARVGEKPSTLRLIYPECYLEEEDKAARIASIQMTMRRYLAEGILRSAGEGFVLVERRTPYEASPRVGLVLALDLERYAYGAGSQSLIRPTEGTIVARLPPRMAIRRGAPLELPHVMVLVDDPARSLIEPIYAGRSLLPRLYDFELMEGSGALRAWKLEGDARLGAFAKALERLADPEAFRATYGERAPLLFAVGDGNHSLATAKAVWEETKAAALERGEDAATLERHPARFALVELLNVYDEGLPFHPIHRVLFHVDAGEFLSKLAAFGAEIRRTSLAREAFAAVDSGEGASGGQLIAYVAKGESGLLRFPNPSQTLASGTVQDFLDPYLAGHPATSIDYIHGSGSLEALGSRPDNLGLYLPPVDKASFFRTVVENGAMPRKTFSMGEASEKRFYMEARRIII